MIGPGVVVRRRGSHLACLIATLAVTAPTRARAANSSILEDVRVYATISSIGVYADYSGDDNENLTAWIEYRVEGGGTWKRGHDMLRIATGRLAGSVFFLDPSTRHEVRVVMTDPENDLPQERMDAATTRADVPADATGTQLWVDAIGGDDGNAGTETSPFRTIQAAADVAQPGDLVHVVPGIYRETVGPPRGGTADAPLWFVAEGSGVILDGSDPNLTNPPWTDEGAGTWSTPFTGRSEYVAVDDQRLYDYPSLAELVGEAAGLPGGFFVDEPQGRLHVRLPDGSSPTGKLLHIAVRDQGFLLDTIEHVVVEGFEFRYFGGTQSGVAVDVRDSSRCWIRDNVVHHMNTGFRVRRPFASENVIEDNEFRDTSVYDWPWDAVKSHTPEASAISITHGTGNVVRRNRLEGSFNGVYTGAFGDSNEDIARDTDVHGNTLVRHGDDGLEPEGAQVNVRMWGNVMRGVKNAVSLAPIEVGPTWIVRNLLQDYQDHVLKVNNGSTGWILVYHNTGVPLPGMAWSSAQAIAPSLPFGPFVSRNNIFEANRYVIEYTLTAVNDGVDLDYDNLWSHDLDAVGRFVKWLNVTYANLAALQAGGTIAANGFEELPEYEDPPNGDFTLVAGHPLIDVGEEIPGINTESIAGAGPDVGAFERGGVGPGDDAGSDDGSGTETSGGDTSGGTGADGGSGDDSGGGDGDAGTDGAGDGGGGQSGGDASDAGCGCRGAPTTVGAPLLVVLPLIRRRGLARP